MKKWKEPAKRGLSLFLALMMCLGLLQISAFAEEAATVQVEVGANTSEIKEALDAALGESPTGTWYYYAERETLSPKNCNGVWFAIGENKHNVKGAVWGTVPCIHANTLEAYSIKSGEHTIAVSPNADGSGSQTVQYVVKSFPKPTIKVNAPSVIMLEHKYVDGKDVGQDWEKIQDLILNDTEVEGNTLRRVEGIRQSNGYLWCKGA